MQTGGIRNIRKSKTTNLEGNFPVLPWCNNVGILFILQCDSDVLSIRHVQTRAWFWHNTTVSTMTCTIKSVITMNENIVVIKLRSTYAASFVYSSCWVVDLKVDVLQGTPKLFNRYAWKKTLQLYDLETNEQFHWKNKL